MYTIQEVSLGHYKKGCIALRAIVIFGMGNAFRYFIGPTNILNNNDSKIEK